MSTAFPSNSSSGESPAAVFLPLVVASVFTFCVCIVIAWLPLCVAHENLTRMKHLQVKKYPHTLKVIQQIHSGACPAAYWLGHLLYDTVTYLLVILPIHIVYAAFTDSRALLFHNGRIFCGNLLLQVFYALAVFPAIYLLTVVVKSPNKVFLLVLIGGICLAVVPFIVDVSMGMVWKGLDGQKEGELWSVYVTVQVGGSSKRQKIEF